MLHKLPVPQQQFLNIQIHFHKQFLMIFTDPSKAPPPPSSKERQGQQDPDAYDSTEHFGEKVYIIDSTGNKSKTTLYEQVLAMWKDPTSPPHSREKCVKTCRSDFPPVKFCCGWKLQYRYIYNTYTVRVSTKTPQHIKRHLGECLKVGAVVAAIAAMKLGGSGAIAAAEKAIYACLATKIDDLLTVGIYTKSRRGDWE